MSQDNKDNVEVPSTMTEMVRSMIIDYAVHEMSKRALREKYNLSQDAFLQIFNRYQFSNRRNKYRSAVLEKTISKLATKQSGMLATVVTILQRQIERTEKWQRNHPNEMLDPRRMQELLAAYTLLNKEHRLNNDQITDSAQISIKVEMPDSMPVITDNNVIDATAEEVPEHSPPIIEEPQVAKEEQEEDKVDPMGFPFE